MSLATPATVLPRAPTRQPRRDTGDDNAQPGSSSTRSNPTFPAESSAAQVAWDSARGQELLNGLNSLVTNKEAARKFAQQIRDCVGPDLDRGFNILERAKERRPIDQEGSQRERSRLDTSNDNAQPGSSSTRINTPHPTESAALPAASAVQAAWESARGQELLAALNSLASTKSRARKVARIVRRDIGLDLDRGFEIVDKVRAMIEAEAHAEVGDAREEPLQVAKPATRDTSSPPLHPKDHPCPVPFISNASERLGSSSPLPSAHQPPSSNLSAVIPSSLPTQNVPIRSKSETQHDPSRTFHSALPTTNSSSRAPPPTDSRANPAPATTKVLDRIRANLGIAEANATSRTTWGMTTVRCTYTTVEETSRVAGTFNLLGVSIGEAKISGEQSDCGQRTGNACSSYQAVSFEVVDPTSVNDCIKVKVHGRPGRMPVVKRGTIVLLQGLSRDSMDLEGRQATGYKGSIAFALFSRSDLLSGNVAPSLSRGVENQLAPYGQDEIAYARDLACWWRYHAQQAQAAKGRTMRPTVMSGNPSERIHGSQQQVIGIAQTSLADITATPTPHFVASTTAVLPAKRTPRLPVNTSTLQHGSTRLFKAALAATNLSSRIPPLTGLLADLNLASTGHEDVSRSNGSIEGDEVAGKNAWGVQTARGVYTTADKIINQAGVYNVIGFCLEDSWGPFQEKFERGNSTGEFIVQIKLGDPTSFTDCIKFKFFESEPKRLPVIKRGTIVLLQGLSRIVVPVDGGPSVETGYEGVRTHYALFSPLVLLSHHMNSFKVDGAEDQPGSYGQDEIAYARDLARWWRDNVGEPSDVPTGQTVSTGAMARKISSGFPGSEQRWKEVAESPASTDNSAILAHQLSTPRFPHNKSTPIAACSTSDPSLLLVVPLSPANPAYALPLPQPSASHQLASTRDLAQSPQIPNSMSGVVLDSAPPRDPTLHSASTGTAGNSTSRVVEKGKGKATRSSPASPRLSASITIRLKPRQSFLEDRISSRNEVEKNSSSDALPVASTSFSASNRLLLSPPTIFEQSAVLVAHPSSVAPLPLATVIPGLPIRKPTPATPSSILNSSLISRARSPLPAPNSNPALSVPSVPQPNVPLQHLSNRANSQTLQEPFPPAEDALGSAPPLHDPMLDGGLASSSSDSDSDSSQLGKHSATSKPTSATSTLNTAKSTPTLHSTMESPSSSHYDATSLASAELRNSALLSKGLERETGANPSCSLTTSAQVESSSPVLNPHQPTTIPSASDLNATSQLPLKQEPKLSKKKIRQKERQRKTHLKQERKRERAERRREKEMIEEEKRATEREEKQKEELFWATFKPPPPRHNPEKQALEREARRAKRRSDPEEPGYFEGSPDAPNGKRLRSGRHISAVVRTPAAKQRVPRVLPSAHPSDPEGDDLEIIDPAEILEVESSKSEEGDQEEAPLRKKRPRIPLTPDTTDSEKSVLGQEVDVEIAECGELASVAEESPELESGIVDVSVKEESSPPPVDTELDRARAPSPPDLDVRRQSSSHNAPYEMRIEVHDHSSDEVDWSVEGSPLPPLLPSSQLAKKQQDSDRDRTGVDRTSTTPPGRIQARGFEIESSSPSFDSSRVDAPSNKRPRSTSPRSPRVPGSNRAEEGVEVVPDSEDEAEAEGLPPAPKPKKRKVYVPSFKEWLPGFLSRAS
ncbi:hypothetical protein P7C70_g5425, partial [Phenoliferia sp. Uapishka_3]